MASFAQSTFSYQPEVTVRGQTPPVAQVVNLPTLINTFVDSAAAMETRLLESERSNQALRCELRGARQDQACVRELIRELRRSHRLNSHSATSKLFKTVTEIVNGIEQRSTRSTGQ